MFTSTQCSCITYHFRSENHVGSGVSQVKWVIHHKTESGRRVGGWKTTEVTATQVRSLPQELDIRYYACFRFSLQFLVEYVDGDQYQPVLTQPSPTH